MVSPRAAPAESAPPAPLVHRRVDQVASRFVLAQCRLSEALHLDDRGATAVEYGLIAAFIAAVIAGVVAALGTKVAGLFTSAINAF